MGRRLLLAASLSFTTAVVFVRLPPDKRLTELGSGLAAAEAPAAGDKAMAEIAHGDSKEPALHGARVVGTTPGRPFLFRVPSTGQGKVRITAAGLPDGLTLDEAGLITGSVKAAGAYDVRLTATSDLGKVSRKLKIVAGPHKLAQTPPMGWNSWNVWGTAVTADHVRQAADAMIQSGLAAKGFTYINIDDAWEGKQRGADGQVTTNEKFGDMKALADYIHTKGLKLGIYSSPGPKTCAGYEGTYQHEEQDARTWAAWGIDYIKYDLCSYGSTPGFKGDRVGDVRKPYHVMRQALDAVDRDIVYSLCEYGMADVWNWGGASPVFGNLWRTTGDITDSWDSMASIGFTQDRLARHAGPGHWNDPDMLVVGAVGWGNPHPTHLTPHEQITHITLWSMLAAPLLIGCDMGKLDPFTTALLTNSEVLDIDQDPLGQQAVRVAKSGDSETWGRPLADGTVAVALFNRGHDEAKGAVKWSDLSTVLNETGGLSGKQPVRDLWKQMDLGSFDGGYQASVASHGAVLLKVGAPRPE